MKAKEKNDWTIEDGVWLRKDKITYEDYLGLREAADAHKKP